MAAPPTRTAVVLAAGRGRRMRVSVVDPALDAAQREAASRGDKVMMPVGRPFLDYVLHSLADAGVRHACIVARPDATGIADRYGVECPPVRLDVSCVTQPDPLGTAHAVQCAEPVVGEEPFLVVNGDNLYPVPALRALAELDGQGLIGFEAARLVADGNIPAGRIARFALVRATPDGFLERIVEKPDDRQAAAMGPATRVSMNAWRFEPSIFSACRRLGPSPRGELELQDAVSEAIASGGRFRVVPWSGGVLDLTSGEDVPGLMQRLRAIEVRL